MTSILPAATCLTALGLLLTAGTSVSDAAGKRSAGAAPDCFTDDGYGRKRSSAAAQYRRREADRNPSECFTDGGYGRFCLDKVKR
jgi:hypothetical protein